MARPKALIPDSADHQRISLEVLAEVLAEQSREQRRAWAEQRRRRLTPGKK